MLSLNLSHYPCICPHPISANLTEIIHLKAYLCKVSYKVVFHHNNFFTLHPCLSILFVNFCIALKHKYKFDDHNAQSRLNFWPTISILSCITTTKCLSYSTFFIACHPLYVVSHTILLLIILYIVYCAMFMWMWNKRQNCFCCWSLQYMEEMFWSYLFVAVLRHKWVFARREKYGLISWKREVLGNKSSA